MFKLQRLEISGFKSFADYTEIVFTGSGITAVVGPNGCGKCVSGDTLVALSDGQEVEIKELVDSALEKSFLREQFDDGFLTHENPENIKILSLNRQTLKLEPRKVSAFIKRQTTAKLLLIRTKSGREIKATPYHPLFTLENGKLRTLRADELKIGLRIAVPRELKTSQKQISFCAEDYLKNFRRKDNAYLPYSENLKNWTDKGKEKFNTLKNWSESANASLLSIRGLRGEQAINIAEIRKFAQDFDVPIPFDYEIKSKRSGNLTLPKYFSKDLSYFLGLLIAEGRNTYSNQIWFVNSDHKINEEYARIAEEIFSVNVSQKSYTANVTDSLIYSKSLCQILEKVFNFPINSNSFEKQVPPQVFRAKNEVKWSFLSGLFEGDAYICSRKQKDNGKLLNYIEYTTASEKLAQQIVSLLLQLGIFAYLRPKKKYASNTENKTIRQYYSVLIYGSKQLKLAAENLSFAGDKQDSLEKLRNIEVANNPNQDLIPSATELVREAVKLAKVKIKPNRKKYPKIAAYTGRICQASRNGLNEVVGQIRHLSENAAPSEPTLEKLSMLANSDVYWDEIVSVQKIAPVGEWVYDLSIDETHNFVAGNIIVHNSNVSDSISWVLGEQKAKSLRGEEMKDVIFQGTSKRQPGGMAEVVLHLERVESEFSLEEDELEEIDETLSDLDENVVDVDLIERENTEFENEQSETVNSEIAAAKAAQIGSVQTVQTKIRTKRHWKPRSFALDFAPGESVSVTRRLYRSGESEYLLNNKTCRLRDIQDLFAGTGLSGAHYAIVEQGRIGQILSSKPSDRRGLIEEAAGISKFRKRQRAAETRLESAKSNLSRISDIVSEIDKQATSLRRQASKTRRYKILREEFRTLLRQTFSAEGRLLTELVGDLDEKLEDAVKAERVIFSNVAEKEEAFRKSTDTAREAEENLSEMRLKHSESALERDRNLREKGYLTEQIANSNRRSGVLEGDIKNTKQRLGLIKTEIERLEKDRKKERTEAEKNTILLREAEDKYHDKLRVLNEIENELEARREEFVQHTAAVERLTEIERQLENTGGRLKERVEGLKREGERAAETFEERKTEAGKLEKTLKAEREKLENLHTEKQEILKQSREAKENLGAAESKLENLQKEFSRTRHRLETLRELEEKRAVYAPSVQKLFAEQKKIGVKFQGTLADELDVEEKAERAVENLFGQYLQSVLVETEKDARKTIKFLNENNLGRIPILVRKAESKNESKKVEANLTKFLGISKNFAHVLTGVFPREMSAQIVEKVEDADFSGDEIFITFGGDLIVGGKLFVGGKSGANEKNTSLLAFKRELRELEKIFNTSAKEIEKAENETNRAREILVGKENKLVDLQSFIVKVERETLAQEIQAKSLAQETERAERHKKIVTDEIEQIETELGEIENKQKEAKTNFEKAEKARTETAQTLEKINFKLNDARAKLEAENRVLNEKKTLAATSDERRRAVETAAKRVENEAKELESRLARESIETKEIAGKLIELSTLITEIESRIEASAKDEDREKDELNEALTHLKAERERADKMSRELAELNKQSAEARNERAALEIRRTEAITKLRSLNEKCSQDLSVSLAELVDNEEVSEDFDLAQAKNRVGELRGKLENFGAINMLALEELSEAEERLLFLTAQRQDIIDGISATEEALREIKRRSREKFREAFEQINANFVEFFQELFGGGKGEMTLLEAEDVLEAGIEIVAQPPGKRLQSILLLSGGEKAMTAIALVLAIFKYRPSPFCLLDEVDAPLDDANVGRFAGKIAEMSEKTQFIVITHNKRTMEAARALYGVTMQEAGVSKLVSVKFE